MKLPKGYKVLPPVHPNAGIRASYRRKLDALIAEMQDSYAYWIKAQYRETPPDVLIAMDARKPRYGEQIDEWRSEGIFLRKDDVVETGSMPTSDFDGTTVKASQNTVDSKGVAMWKRRIRAGERPAVLLEETSPGKYRIVDGHHRATAYEALGIKNVPVVIKNKLQPTIATPAEHLDRELRNLGLRWEAKFEEAAPKLARWFTKSAGDRSQARLQQILRDGGMSVRFEMTAPMRDIVRATLSENVGLIKSIQSQYHTEVQGMVMRSVTAGRDLGMLTDELTARYGITRRRAAGIALDQNNKATSAMVQVRQAQFDCMAIWLHSTAGKVPRKTHVANSGKLYDPKVGWHDPDPKVNKRIWPGQLIKCRCVSRTVIKGFS